MELHTHRFCPGEGWNREPDGSLDSAQTLVILFGASRSQEAGLPLEEIRGRFPHSHCIGCSTAGEIYRDELSENSLVLAIARFEHTRLRTASAPILTAEESARAGRALADTLLEEDLRGVLIFSDGLSVNGSQLIEGLNQVLPASVTVTGGLAGDDARFERTWLLSEQGVVSGQVCAVGLYGDAVGLGYGSQGGWDPLGPQREVTASKGNLLYELDGQPALDVYKRYLGERAEGLPATGLLFPLSMRDEANPDEEKVRTILAIDEDRRSITFAGDIPTGSQVRLMYANFDRLVQGAADAAESVDMSRYKVGSPILCIAISCVGRLLVLGQRVEEEIEAVLEVLPGHTQQVGYYSYGEISPLNNGRCDLHNQTMTLTLIWEQVN